MENLVDTAILGEKECRHSALHAHWFLWIWISLRLSSSRSYFRCRKGISPLDGWKIWKASSESFRKWQWWFSASVGSIKIMSCTVVLCIYTASSCLQQSGNFHSTLIANGSSRKTNVRVQVDKFPERPGQPECDYFMKTGNCRFKYTCRFHHPKHTAYRADECVLNENGLPLRPDRSICRHYERLGLRKFGSACMFDHPANLGLSTYPDWPSTTGTAVECSGGSWED